MLEIHRELMRDSDPEIAGRWRDQPVWIGRGGSIPHNADFVPPHQELVPGLMDDLAEFAARTDIQPLAQAALVHAQFETIHPFADGNGRAGRALVHTLLRARGIIRYATVPVSAGLLSSTRDYFEALTDYRNGDAVPIVEQVAEATMAAIDNGNRLATDLAQIREDWRGGITARSDSSGWSLLDLAIQRPVLTAAAVAAGLGVSERAARNALNSLTEQGVLSETTTRKRDRVWQAPAVLATMDEFAARSGRRGWA